MQVKSIEKTIVKVTTAQKHATCMKDRLEAASEMLNTVTGDPYMCWLPHMTSIVSGVEDATTYIPALESRADKAAAKATAKQNEAKRLKKKNSVQKVLSVEEKLS